MDLTGIKETCLYVSDLETTREFYEDKLGLSCFSSSDYYVFFKVGNSVLLCFLPTVTKQQENLPRHFANGEMHLAFEISEATYISFKEKVQAHSISIEHEQIWSNNKRSFYVRDPDNHSIEIVMEGMWD